KQLKRAGLDYHEYATVRVHGSWAEFGKAMAGRRMYAFTSAGMKVYTEIRYAPDDVLVFGTEATGLPAEVVNEFAPDMRLRLPMRPGNRSLNLSNAVAVAVFEAWRQLGFQCAVFPRCRRACRAGAMPSGARSGARCSRSAAGGS